MTRRPTTRLEKKLHRRELDTARRAWEKKPPLLDKGQAYKDRKSMFTPPKFTPERDVQRENWPEEMPTMVRDWADLYLTGHSVANIYAIVGGPHKPHTIRRELRKWGVPMRKPGTTGRGPGLLVRVSELEFQMRTVTAQMENVLDYLRSVGMGSNMSHESGNPVRGV